MEWTKFENHLEKELIFSDFREAMGAMVRISYIAEEMNHHPEWSNVYNRVDVTLTTHDVDGLSSLDIMLAQKMDQLTA